MAQCKNNTIEITHYCYDNGDCNRQNRLTEAKERLFRDVRKHFVNGSVFKVFYREEWEARPADAPYCVAHPGEIKLIATLEVC